MSASRFFFLLAVAQASAFALFNQAQASDLFVSEKAQDGWIAFANIDLWDASDFMPASKIEGDWNTDFSPRAGRNTSLRRYRAELGAGYKDWRLSLEARQDGMLTASASTLAFVRAYKLGGLPQQPVSYQLDAQMQSWSGFGIRAGRWFEFGSEYQPKVFASVVYYTKPQYRAVQANGAADYIDRQHYSFSASEIDANSRYQYLFRQFEPEATGYSSSLELDWKLNQVWRIQYQLDDAFNRFAWKNLPELQQSLNSAVVQYDSRGYLNYQPLLQGRNSQGGRSISVPATHTARISYARQQWEFAAQVRHFYGENLPEFSVSKDVAYGRVSVDLDTRYKSIGLGWNNDWLSLHLQTDKLNLASAKVLGLGVQLHRQF
ncbi:hypothetical protein [Undibacterium sp. TS12]|uniref:hypothetical protein n=1 Tax=Undibacterium sp. TS12 TaxID=2908202 RepID=UPI001F4D2637|nr:hypothetical protein [Undibacterium sp. TS12]MCH8618887.1 hypothetical protein [Undibacterium sp. TS12]